MNKKDFMVDLTQLEPIDKLDEEEQILHQALKKGNFILNTDKAMKMKYSQIFKKSNQSRRAISLRIPENDYINIKAKALELGIPYQSLINSIIHNFLVGDILKLSALGK